MTWLYPYSVDTYQSHEGILYCKPHFKSLFAPKIVEESTEPVKPRKLEMIILENQPIELPADVVRVSTHSFNVHIHAYMNFSLFLL